MSYNMLADELAIKHAHELYRAVPHWCLQWQHRFKLLVQEIKHWRPDLGGLQELDHLEEFEEALEMLGYEGRFAGRGGTHHDGCYSFWRTDQFTLADSQTISFEEHKLRENVALLVLLRPKHPGPLILLANTHLLFNPKRGDIKIGQARMIADAMAAMQNDAQDPVALFLLGDFNSGAGSAVYRFLQTGFLDCAAEDRRNLSGQLLQDTDFSSSHTFNQGVPEPPAYQQCVPAYASSQPFSIQVDVQLPEHHGGNWLSNPCTPRSSLDMLPGPVRHQGPFRATSCKDEGPLSRHSSGGRGRPTTVQHSLSFPCMPAMAQEQGDPEDPRYLYTDQFGQQTWSHVPPPAHVDLPRHMFFHDPMCCEEASPAGPPPRSLFRSPLELERRKNLATWSLEQLQNAVGPSASSPAGQHAAAASARAHSSSSNGHINRHPSGIPHSNNSSMHDSNHAGQILSALTEAPPVKSQKKSREQTSSGQAQVSAFSPPQSPFVGDLLRDSSVHSRASARDLDVSNHSRVSELSSLSEAEPLTNGEMEAGAHSKPINVPSRQSMDTMTAAHVRAAVAAVTARAAEQDPAVRQALASRRSSEWAGMAANAQQQQQQPQHRGRGSKELSRKSSLDVTSHAWIARHPLQLCSATHDILGKELPYTSCHSKFIGSVDFVWFGPTAGDFAVVAQRVLLPPPLESLSCGLPSPQWPSDHISLVFDFHLLQ